MPMDANIILGAKQPEIQNPLDMMSKAMAFKSLANRSQLEELQLKQNNQQFGDEQAMRQAYSKNITVDPNSNASFNKNGYLQDLAKTAPHLVPKAQQQMYDMDNARAKAMLEHLSVGAQILNGVSDQASYDKARVQAANMGGDISQWPAQFDPAHVKMMQAQVLSVKEQQEMVFKQQGLDIEGKKAVNEGKKLDVELFKTFGNPVGQGAGNKSTSPADPSSLVNRHVPPDRQTKVFEEIKAAQNTTKSAPQILAAFDRAANNVHGADFVPGVANADQKALHALMGPTFQDVEGTVRQAAMDNMNENTTPQVGDNAKTIATKREALVGYLTSKSAAPTAKGFGIDLSKFPSTSIDPKVLTGGGKDKKASTTASTPPPEGSTKEYNGVTYKVVGNHWVAQTPVKQAAK